MAATKRSRKKKTTPEIPPLDATVSAETPEASASSDGTIQSSEEQAKKLEKVRQYANLILGALAGPIRDIPAPADGDQVVEVEGYLMAYLYLSGWVLESTGASEEDGNRRLAYMRDLIRQQNTEQAPPEDFKPRSDLLERDPSEVLN